MQRSIIRLVLLGWAFVLPSCGDNERTQLLQTGINPFGLVGDRSMLCWFTRVDPPSLSAIRCASKQHLSSEDTLTMGVGGWPVIVGGNVYGVRDPYSHAGPGSAKLLRYDDASHEKVIANMNPQGGPIATDDSRIFFSTFDFASNASQIWSQTLDDSPAQLVLADTHGQVEDLVAEGQEILFTVDADRSTVPYANDVRTAVRRVFADGGTPTTLLESNNVAAPRIAISPTAFFFLEPDPLASPGDQRGMLRKMNRQTGEVTAFVPVDVLRAMIADATYVYWAQSEYQRPFYLGDRIYRLPQDGGAPERLAETSLPINGLFVDDDYLYWTTFFEARVPGEPGTLNRTRLRP